jgi:hypothetical protein
VSFRDLPCAAVRHGTERHGGRSLVRLQVDRIGGVEVPVEVGLHFLTERNCVAARRGGEQREVNG